LFRSVGADSERPSGKLGQMFGKIWPLLLSLWMVVLFENWGRSLFINDIHRNDAMMVAWWVMMKLILRLAYSTDPERVRKLVKKIGQELMQHPEIGQKFMEPLESQGVFSMEDDSGMMFRVKFMTKLGDQFVARKTVYAAIHDRFEKEGIEFAHRVVTVKVDDGPLSAEAKQKIAAATLPVIQSQTPAPAGGDAR
jgi:moderate conductance mechanosensitive channel